MDQSPAGAARGRSPPPCRQSPDVPQGCREGRSGERISVARADGSGSARSTGNLRGRPDGSARRPDRPGRRVEGADSDLGRKGPTARSLRGWIRGVLSWAQAHGHVEINYAGECIDGALPKAKAPAKEHRAALPYSEVGAALAKVDASTAGETTKACLRFLTLTAVRSGEARGATWDEIDLDAREWRLPASRMKTGEPHRVPLSGPAVTILEAMRPLRGQSDLVFPGAQGKPISQSTLIKALQTATNTTASVHGFRSSFRTWSAEKTSATRDIAEMCLAHVVGSDIERFVPRGRTCSTGAAP